MNCRIKVSVVHRDEVMTEHTSPCCSVFQRDADVIVVLDCRQTVFSLGIAEETVVVTTNQDDLTVQIFNQILCGTVFRFPDHITEDIYKISPVNLCVPSPDEFRIHFVYRFKRSVIKADDIFMSEVQIACKINFIH